MLEENSTGSPNPWTTFRIVGSTLLVAAVWIVAQIVGIVLAAIIAAVLDPSLDPEAFAAAADSDGLVLSVVTVFSTIVVVGLVFGLLAGRDLDATVFLGFARFPVRALLLPLVLLAALLAAAEVVRILLDRPSIPPYWVPIFESARSLSLLGFAMIVAAPLAEELFFRGYLHSALRARGLSFGLTAIIASALWAAIHTQYDFVELATIFVLGLLLAWARERTASLWAPLALHALNNGLAFGQMLLTIPQGGG